jgi:aryl-alcohol dehydrogenase-like predicted oxidoreductase
VPIEVAVDHCGPLIRDDEPYEFAAAPAVEFLRQAKASGKARFIGITGKDARRLARIVEAVEFDAMMMAHQFNPVMRNAGRFLLATAAARNVGLVNGAPFMKGWLAAPQEAWRTSPPPWMDEPFRTAYFAYLDIHARRGLPLAELTLRWQLAETRQHCIVVGFSRITDIELNVAPAARGPRPADLQRAIDGVGIVHPLIYQGRSAL